MTLRQTTLAMGLLAFFAALTFGTRTAPAQDDQKPVVVMETSMGTITIELDAKNAPITTANFLQYVDDKFFDGLTFHRVIPGFMVQGGGFDPQLQQKREGLRAPIANEHANGLTNQRGTLSMARTSNPNSATSQFFINVVDNAPLDQGDGYAVFGRVISGMDVVDRIVNVPTARRRSPEGSVMGDVPVEPVVIKSVRRKGKG